MIEAIDLGVIATLLGKIGWDERTRRKNGPNGNGPIVARLTTLEVAVNSLMQRVDRGFDGLGGEIKEARDSRGDLRARITEAGERISHIEGRLDNKGNR